MRIVDNVRPDRQTVMFSATFPRAMEALARRILLKPLEIQVGGRSVVCSDVEQHVVSHLLVTSFSICGRLCAVVSLSFPAAIKINHISDNVTCAPTESSHCCWPPISDYSSTISAVQLVIDEDKKFLKLLELLGHYQETGSVIIFVDKQEHADALLKDLMKASYPCMSLHGGEASLFYYIDLFSSRWFLMRMFFSSTLSSLVATSGIDQYDRDSIINDFKNGACRLMVATSVAARGLDVKQLILVINYSCPNHYEDYIHRAGRTGRAGNKVSCVKQDPIVSFCVVLSATCKFLSPWFLICPPGLRLHLHH